MSNPTNPEVTPSSQPNPTELDFDLRAALSSVVGIRTTVAEDALTAPVLGSERSGHGVLIDDTGLILTIGYLVTEAESVWLINDAGNTLPGHVVGYDQESGFGLVQTLGRLDRPCLDFGRAANLALGDPVIAASHGGLSHALRGQVVAKREFAGYWEYVLDEAIFTAPAHPSWGGAALIGRDGKLYGIGSLLVQEAGRGGSTSDCNMFVPIDILLPVLDDLRLYGRPNRPPRPWLGVFIYDVGEQLVVAGIFKDCPAHRADLRPGDALLEVNGMAVSTLSDLFRGIWALGDAGTPIPLTVLRDAKRLDITVHSVDRNDCLKAAALH